MSEMTLNNDHKNIELTNSPISPFSMDNTSKFEERFKKYRRYSGIFEPPQTDKSFTRRSSMTVLVPKHASTENKENVKQLRRKSTNCISITANSTLKKRDVSPQDQLEQKTSKTQTDVHGHHQRRRKSCTKLDQLFKDTPQEIPKNVNSEIKDKNGTKRMRQSKSMCVTEKEISEKLKKVHQKHSSIIIEAVEPNAQKITKYERRKSKNEKTEDRMPTAKITILEQNTKPVVSTKKKTHPQTPIVDKTNLLIKLTTMKNQYKLNNNKFKEEKNAQNVSTTNCDSLIHRSEFDYFDETSPSRFNRRLDFDYDSTEYLIREPNSEPLKLDEDKREYEMIPYYDSEYRDQIDNTNYEHPDLLKYYTDKTIKKFNNLETIFEQPKGKSVMGKRKLKRYLTFENSVSLKKQSKRKIKARKVNPFFRMESLNWNKLELLKVDDLFN